VLKTWKPLQAYRATVPVSALPTSTECTLNVAVASSRGQARRAVQCVEPLFDSCSKGSQALTTRPMTEAWRGTQASYRLAGQRIGQQGEFLPLDLAPATAVSVGGRPGAPDVPGWFPVKYLNRILHHVD
jgi:hypothetical protein